MKEHYEERLAFARESDDFVGWTDEIMRTFVRDLKGGLVPPREVQSIARMLDDASCEAATAAKAVA